MTYQNFGVTLQFTPYITDRTRIRLQLNASVSTPSTATTSVNGAQVPSQITQRQFITTVELREGQTLTVAGLIQNNFSGTSNRVPFWGDLPLIGRTGGVDSISSGEQELVVLVTPVLVHPLEQCQTPPLPGNDIFEPGDVAFYLGGQLESRAWRTTALRSARTSPGRNGLSTATICSSSVPTARPTVAASWETDPVRDPPSAIRPPIRSPSRSLHRSLGPRPRPSDRKNTS